jgi:hypothetical protein
MKMMTMLELNHPLFQMRTLILPIQSTPKLLEPQWCREASLVEQEMLSAYFSMSDGTAGPTASLETMAKMLVLVQ